MFLDIGHQNVLTPGNVNRTKTPNYILTTLLFVCKAVSLHCDVTLNRDKINENSHRIIRKGVDKYNVCTALSSTLRSDNNYFLGL